MNKNAHLEYEVRKKSGVIAALLNFIFPGAGYVYCGNYILGLLAFLITVIAAIFTMGLSLLVTEPIMIIDGFLVADRANKQILKKVLKQ
jgi:hypothetical protein